ncbi:TBC1 domain family member 13-like isoform X1 [Carex littledalei]|uniref:TBC1 domain family member 13-like isoform X1 n=1 Tax=Carex littledalei TaxID=544730 RepID=A0A833QX32_9POAL|nr:TBC1 domain family member 13-like isoform X1 [Carex littledalei]
MQRKGALVEWLSDSLWASVSPRRNGGGATAPSSCSPPSSPSQTESEISRQSLLFVQLSKEVVDLDELRKLASEGIPDVAGIRSTVWKLLLGYLPMDRHSWREELEKRRAQYMAFKNEFLLENMTEVSRRVEEASKNMAEILINKSSEPLERSNIAPGEHPLSQRQSSIWNQFFQDSEMIEQIDWDVKRTHPDMNFFCGDSSLAMSNQDSLRNVLIIFAKLNSGLRYVQGMNEILAPLFYVFRSDPDVTNAAWAEADSFFCFVELLSGFRDHFCQKLDNSAVGIISTLNKLSQLLKLHDPEVWHHLEVKTEVNPQFYAFRWITLLLTHEFNLADTLHIWDVLLSDPQGPQETLLRVCCAMVILARKRILSGDFTSNVKLLQNYPPTNISHLLYVANKLRV